MAARPMHSQGGVRSVRNRTYYFLPNAMLAMLRLATTAPVALLMLLSLARAGGAKGRNANRPPSVSPLRRHGVLDSSSHTPRPASRQRWYCNNVDLAFGTPPLIPRKGSCRGQQATSHRWTGLRHPTRLFVRHDAETQSIFESESQPFVGSRRQAVEWLAESFVTSAATAWSVPALAAADDASSSSSTPPGQMDVDNFLRTGMVPNPMGVSGQAGKSRPETGVLLREGSDVRRDAKSGDVLAELLLKSTSSSSGEQLTPVVATFQSPWPLATGTVFDVECRDPKTGDGVFLQVTPPLPASVSTAAALSDSFLVDQLVSPTGRFSFYGAPTDVRVRKSDASAGNDNYKVLDVSFSIISQSTQTELPRQARIVAAVPAGTSQAVMLVASTGALRWKKVEPDVAKIVQSFKAIPAPPTQLKVRAKERR